jgi:hypothetical protein
LATDETVRPESEEHGESLGRVFDSRSQFAGARKSGLGFWRAVAARMQHGLAVAGLQLEPLLTRRDRALHILGLGKRSEQHLCLANLGKLRRRRKAFKRRGQYAVRIDSTIRRLIELR